MRHALMAFKGAHNVGHDAMLPTCLCCLCFWWCCACSCLCLHVVEQVLVMFA